MRTKTSGVGFPLLVLLGLVVLLVLGGFIALGTMEVDAPQEMVKKEFPRDSFTKVAP